MKIYDHQDVRAVTTLGADGAPLDGPEIVAGMPAGSLAKAVTRPKPTTISGIESGALAAK